MKSLNKAIAVGSVPRSIRSYAAPFPFLLLTILVIITEVGALAIVREDNWCIGCPIKEKNITMDNVDVIIHIHDMSTCQLFVIETTGSFVDSSLSNVGSAQFD